MKKLVAILFSALYLFSTAGMPLYTHYCGGALLGVDVTPVSCCCSAVKSMDENGCCSEELEILQLDNAHHICSEVSNDISINQTCFLVPFLQFEELNQSFELNIENNSDPPPPDKIPLWLSLSHFTYYG